MRVEVITKSEELPAIGQGTFFHGVEMFKMVERTPGLRPLMAVAYDEEGAPVAQLMVQLRRRGSLVPPYLFTQGRAYGEGWYAEGCDRELVFGEMLRQLTQRLGLNTCLYVEFSDLSTKMFGYDVLRRCGFFPVRWMEIHNSLHSKTPEERLTDKMSRRIDGARRAGFVTKEENTDEGLHTFYNIVRRRTSLFKVRRYIPNIRLFEELTANDMCSIFITRSKEGVAVGGCACVYSDGNCYLWYLRTKKSLWRRRVAADLVWAAINNAYRRGCQHIYFLDVGLPFKKNPYREFILGFGGKPVGTYRWFRCSVGWINKLLSWMYRE